ncbi:hypothetical protein I3271_07015 [Photobacterium leiognathi]|uniref:hypothetical protein n=1 Tax=Photobacterium leiognathi TaxID=553611 RepID=UPI001EE0ABEC|nr:hypothetical protein [Photobacterium leiognathi]MCG3884436.1 hypothetical protein [Photobacterium leiognathi]
MPTLMLYPNKENPSGYRIQDKALKVNICYTSSKYGDLDNAKKAADADMLKFTAIRKEFDKAKKRDINRLFNVNGSVKGLVVRSRVQSGVLKFDLVAQISPQPGKQIKTSRRIRDYDFDGAYLDIQAWILSKMNIARTDHITAAFKKAERFHKEQFSRCKYR